MIEELKNYLEDLNEGITYAELSDQAWSKAYTLVLKERRIIKRTIRKLERLERKLKRAQESWIIF